MKVFPSFLQLHGKTYDYKIPYTSVLRLFLLPHKDQRFMFFVVRKCILINFLNKTRSNCSLGLLGVNSDESNLNSVFKLFVVITVHVFTCEIIHNATCVNDTGRSELPAFESKIEYIAAPFTCITC